MAESFTRIPNYFIDEMLTKLTPHQGIIMVVIYRKTTGWEKKEAGISIREISAITGIKNYHTILTALAKLEEIGLILRTVIGRKTLIRLKNIHPFKDAEGGKVLTGSQHQMPESVDAGSTKPLTDGQQSQKMTVDSGSTEMLTVDQHHIHNRQKTKKEREKGRENENRFPFLEELDEAEFFNVVEKYLANVSREVKRPSAYRAKVRKNIEGGDLDSLKELEIFYRVKSLQDLTESYRHRSLGEEQIVDIYTAAEVDQIEGHDPAQFDSEQRWFLRLRNHARRVDRIVGYRSRRELEAAVRSALATALADSGAGDAA